MSHTLRSRSAFFLWAFLACPFLAWGFTLFVAGGDGGLAKFALLFIALPGALAYGGGLLAQRPVAEVLVRTFAAAVLGGMSWILTILQLASRGVYDTAPL